MLASHLTSRASERTLTALAAFALIALTMTTGCRTAPPQRNHSLDTQMFLSHFIPLHGLWIDGAVDPDYTPAGTFVGEPLRMKVLEVGEEGAAIAFHVDEDASRTWVLTVPEDGGLHLRHDHRDPDGTPHDLTDYGGYGHVGADWSTCSFAADDLTARMLPEAATNVWTMTIDFDNEQFIYNLTRHDRPRFRAVFDLTTRRPADP